eukprot:4577449-Alexandrium_andersonii.AAC.1
MPIPMESAPSPPLAMPIGTEVPPPPPQGSTNRSASEETVPIERHQPTTQGPIGVQSLGARNHEETIPSGTRGNTPVVAPGISVDP